jgi:hypothetical protein
MRICNTFFFAIFLGFNISSVFAVGFNPEPEQLIKEIARHDISGTEMAGMKVFVDSTPDAEWNGSSATGDGWELSYRGSDTLGGRWKFSNNTLASVNTVKLDAFGADAVFDYLLSPNGTENSDRGSYAYIQGTGPDVKDEFSGAVKIDGLSAPEGDLYRWLTFDFTDAGGLLQGQSFEFIVDSDNFSAVPLPPGIILLFSSLLGLIGLKRNRG